MGFNPDGGGAIASATDVSFSNLQNDQILTYISSADKWQNQPSQTAQSSMGWLNVKDFGATGDNSTDDVVAINAAFDAVPASGGVVFFPPGIYRVSAPLITKPYTHIVGSEPASRYYGASEFMPPSNCAIRVRSNFVGSALLPYPSNMTASSIRNITLFGGYVGSVHGMDFQGANFEQNFVGQNFSVIGFGGDGIRGRLFASRFHNFLIGGNNGWGLTSSIRFNDTFFSHGYIVGNKAGGLNLDGTGSSGFVDFTNIRFERSGWKHFDIYAPFSTDAPGIRIKWADSCRFTTCSTDANSGHGLDIEMAAGKPIGSIDFISFTFKRDGFGTMASQGEFAGVRVAGYDNAGTRMDISKIRFIGCSVLPAYAVDGGNDPGYKHPKYGLWADRTAHIQWIGGEIKGDVTDFYSSLGVFPAWNYRPQFYLQQQGIMTTPLGSTRPTVTFQGQQFYDTTLTRPIWYSGTTWRDASGASV